MPFKIRKLTFVACFFIGCHSVFAQLPYNIILGRPTDASVTASVLFEQDADFYLTYGITSGVYFAQTDTVHSLTTGPDEVDLINLNANTRYYYCMHYKLLGGGGWQITPEFSFHTQRPAGSSFTFTIEADEHLYDKKGVENMYRVTLANEAADNPDFMLSLGDIFGDDHDPFNITPGALDTLHRNYRPFLGSVCHSIPFYVCLGNHEGEMDYYYNQTPPNNLCVWGTQSRQKYYPNPFPNSFYSGNTALEPYGIGSPENYYAWNWGDALFVVLDVYRDQCDTSAKPKNWNWTLGFPQYTWLKNTLENSTAKYKFVFAHHIRGQGRGGVEEAILNEWGGLQSVNGNNTFAINRPGWAKPIHQLFVDNGVNVFFQGHDHVFAHEVLDSVTYQACPMAADSTYEIGFLANADAYVSDTVDGTGHIRVQVSAQCVQVDYIKAYLPADTVSGLHHNREIGFSYNVGCSPASVSEMPVAGDIKVYPNPAGDLINIRLAERFGTYSYQLLDMLGNVILKDDKNVMDVSKLPEGVYFLRVETSESSFMKKFVVAR